MMGEDEQRRIVLVLMWMHMQWIRSLAYVQCTEALR